MAGSFAVEARTLSKQFGSHTAVDGVSFTIPTGGCFGILGPNGAGKTTTIRMITCVSPPTGGELTVLGQDVRGDRRRIKSRLGVVPQGMTLDTELTVRENLLSFAHYHHINSAVGKQRANELLEFAQLTERADAAVDDLSGGMQRRLLIARALINDPDFIILDEPTTGLDPQARHMVWDRLRRLLRQGKTLLITTHYMEEAAQLCDTTMVMDHGRIIASGTPRDLIHRHVARQVIELHRFPQDRVASLRSALRTLAQDIEVGGDRVLVYADDASAAMEVVKVETAQLDVDTTVRDATLEDVFLRLTGHELVED